MIRQELRKVLYRQHGEVKEMMLSTSQRSVVAHVLDNIDTTASELAIKKCITVQNASVQLKSLCDRGWLDRRELHAPSGGIEWAYRAAFNP